MDALDKIFSDSTRVGSEAPPHDSALWNLLGQRFGDGSVYVHDPAERSLLHKAMSLGLIDAEGYLTALGYHFRRRVRF